MRSVLLACVFVLVLSESIRADHVVLLNGQTVAEKVSAIADGKVRCGKETYDLQQMRSIVFDVATNPVPLRAKRVYLNDQSVLIASKVGVADQQCTIDWTYGESVNWPTADIAAILLAPLSADARGRLKPEPVFTEALADPKRTQDRLLVFSKESITAVDGALSLLTDEQATFVWQDKPRKIKRSKLYGMVLATSKTAVDRTGWCHVKLNDGSQLWGRSPQMKDGMFTMQREAGTFTFPAKSVVRIDVRSDRMIFLSDMTPVSVEDEALFTFNGWRRDASTLGRPLTLNKKVYTKGLGTHAPCRLTYALDDRFDTFAAVIGIDDATFGKGDCVFKLELDGKTIFEQRIRGTDEPLPVRVSIAGGKSLALVAEIGEDLDLADHANWADARLVREKQ